MDGTLVTTFTDANGLGCAAVITWNEDDPLSIRFEFDGQHVWVFARDLVRHPFTNVPKEYHGDVAFFSHRNKLYIGLSSPSGETVLKFNNPQVVMNFLEQSYRIVPEGDEFLTDALDRELSTILPEGLS